MATASLHTPQFQALARTFAAAFDALSRLSPAEAALLWHTIASHIRSAEPMALAAAQPVAMAAVKVPIGDGWYELRAEDGTIQLYVMDASGHDVSIPLTTVPCLSGCHPWSA